MRLAIFLLVMAAVGSGAPEFSSRQEKQGEPLKKAEEAKPGPVKPGQSKEAEERKAAAKAEEEAVAGAELEQALERAGNDRAALVRELDAYLKKFPDAPRKAAVLRALVEAAIQLREKEKAIEYAERAIALRPEDTSLMMLAAELLEEKGDEKSLTRAAGYVTRVLDRVEKAPEGGKPARMSAAEWKLEQAKLAMSLYLVRGRLEMGRRNYDAAEADFAKSYELVPSAEAAAKRGEIAEIRKENARAVEHYINAFVMAEEMDSGVDRRDVRRKLGNLWKMEHGSEAGLGEKLLEAYDAVESGAAERALPNKDAKAVEEFVLRRPEGGVVRLAEMKGRVVVLNFWATWCGPCRELEPLFEQVMRQFEGSEVTFLAVSGDEVESRVLPYMAKEKMKAPVAFDDGLGEFLGVQAYPTVMVLDREGKIVFSARGFDAEGFVGRLAGAVRKAVNREQ